MTPDRQPSENAPSAPQPASPAIELAARLIVLQILTDAIQALEHP